MNFTRKVERVARRQYRRGKITREEYDKVLEAVSRPDVMAKLEEEVAKKIGAPWRVKRVGGLDFNELWDWFIENWPEIMKLLLMVLPLFLLTPPPEEPTEEVS